MRDLMLGAALTWTIAVALRLMPAQLDTTSEMIAHFQQLAEHEKASLARKLHDEVGGLLIGAVMDIAIGSPPGHPA
jgi:signal transduction histidine kinase